MFCQHSTSHIIRCQAARLARLPQYVQANDTAFYRSERETLSPSRVSAEKVQLAKGNINPSNLYLKLSVMFQDQEVEATSVTLRWSDANEILLHIRHTGPT